MNAQMKLKEKIKAIIDNDWTIPEDIDNYVLAIEMLDNIGSTDYVLRDDYILGLLWTIIKRKDINKQQIKQILQMCLSDKHLYYMLGSQSDDSVFNRTFTVLIVGCIISYHNEYEQDLLSEKEIGEAFEKIISYIRQEKDVRGYVEDKGWAHAVAHSADTLAFFANCEMLKKHELVQILSIIKQKACISDSVYINEEAERLVTAIIAVLNRKVLCDTDFVEWIKSFEDIEPPANHPNMHYWKENTKNLCRSLYFRLKYKKYPQEYLEAIEDVLNKINESFNKS